MSEDVSVDELVDLIRNPPGTDREARGRCVFSQAVSRLPEHYQTAIAMTIGDPDVTHPDIVAFINDNTDESVTLSAVQRHRNKKGCAVCLYGKRKA